jgi:hypothetical protein
VAIAVLSDEELLESPWPQPALQLVAPSVGEIPSFLPIGEGADGALPIRTGIEVSVRRQACTSLRVRRRRAAAIALVVGLLVLLALPVSALGGRPITATPPALSAGSPGHGVVYVVQPGDTLWSIASRLEGSGNPRPLVEELSAQLGSGTVFPGERIVLP